MPPKLELPSLPIYHLVFLHVFFIVYHMIVCFMLIFLLLWVAGGDLPVLRHDLGGSAAHVVVGTGYGEAGTHLAEQHGAVCHAGAACSGLPRQSCLQRRRDGATARS